MAETVNDTPPAESTGQDSLRTRLAATEQELANYKLRLADYENARKRLLRDVEVERKYAIEPLARDLLGALDNLDRALAAAKRAGDDGPLAFGVAATVTQILDALRRHGITRIDCGPGTPFDTNRHEAVTQQSADEFEPGQVVAVLQQGFMIHDRVLRPAGVIVAANE
jgi:molecular chaperone GrpE